MSDTQTVLDDEQLRAYLDAARETGDDRDRLVVFTLANTGLHHRELAHMTADWLHLDRDHVRVPAVEECDCEPCQRRLAAVREAKPTHEPLLQRYLGLASEQHDAKEQMATITDQADVEALEAKVRDLRACRAAVRELLDANAYHTLQNRAPGRVDDILARSDGIWWSHELGGERTIPLLDPATREYLADWFATHEAIGMGPREIHRRVRTVAAASPVDAAVDPLDLRRAYRRRLADLGFSALEMRAVLGAGGFVSVERFLQERTSRVQDAFVERWEGLWRE